LSGFVRENIMVDSEFILWFAQQGMACKQRLPLSYILQALVSVSTVGTLDDLSDEQLTERVKAELAGWFGSGAVASWRHLRTYRIPFAQPNQVGAADSFANQLLGVETESGC
jgi:hypothetical protein